MKKKKKKLMMHITPQTSTAKLACSRVALPLLTV